MDWMVIATITIAIATIVNVILFVVYQSRQNSQFEKFNKANVAMQYIGTQLSRLKMLQEDCLAQEKRLFDAAKRGDRWALDQLKASFEDVRVAYNADVKMINETIDKLGLADVVPDTARFLIVKDDKSEIVEEGENRGR